MSPTTPTRRGRPPAAINLLEILTGWEGRGGRRPLSQHQLATRLGVSRTTLRKHLNHLRATGQLDDHARAHHLATRGGQRPGGRPSTPINDTALRAAWAACPTITAVARTLHVRRSRVRTRLQQLGLLTQNTPGEPRC